MNKIPALVVVTYKPRGLTRKELSELAAILDEQNYSERMLRAAYGKARSSDIRAPVSIRIINMAKAWLLSPANADDCNQYSRIHSSVQGSRGVGSSDNTSPANGLARMSTHSVFAAAFVQESIGTNRHEFSLVSQGLAV